MLRIWLPQDDNVVFSKPPLEGDAQTRSRERSLEAGAELLWTGRFSVSPRGEARIKGRGPRWLGSPEAD